MATADVSHHCTITVGATTYGFTLDERDPFRELDVNEFSPQVSAGAKGYGDLSLFSVVAQEDWRHGFGFVYHSDEMGYCYSGDHIDARFSGFVQLATALTSTDASGHAVNAFRDFGSTPAVYAACTTGGIRKRTSDAPWGDITNTTPAMTNTESIWDLIDTGDYLVASRDAARVLKSTTGDTNSWSNAGSDANPPNDFRHLALGGGRVWGSEDGKNLIHYCSATNLSDWEGNGDTDDLVITVGPGTVAIQKMVWFQNSMNVGRTDGLWIIGDDNTARQVLNFYNSKATNNFDGMCIGPDDRLYFPIRDKVYRWTGRNLEDITPGNWGEFGQTLGGIVSREIPRFGSIPKPTPGYASGERPPYKFYIQFHSMFTDGIYIYVIGRTSDAAWQEDLLCWTGSGWHKLYELITGGTYTGYAGYYSPGVARMLMSIGGTTTTTYMVKRNSGSPLPYDAYPVGGNHYLHSSKINLGLLEIDKCFDALDVRSFGCSTGHYTIGVEYQIDDDGTWRPLGTVTTSPYQRLDFPSTYNTGKIIQFRFNLSTDYAPLTPYLDSTAFRLIARPPTYYGLILNIKVGNEITRKDGVTERRTTAEDLRTALHACRDSITPVTAILPLGIQITGYVTAYNLAGVQYGLDVDPTAVGTLQIAQIS